MWIVTQDAKTAVNMNNVGVLKTIKYYDESGKQFWAVSADNVRLLCFESEEKAEEYITNLVAALNKEDKND